mgnify:CR=1 FL=1
MLLGRAGALADEYLADHAFLLWSFAIDQLEHGVKRGHTHPKLGLANGGERHAVMFARENVAEAGDGKFIGDFHTAIEEDVRRTDSDEVIDGCLLYTSDAADE